MPDAFDELIATITDEGDRNSLLAMSTRHKILREGYLRQSDYDRMMNEAKKANDKLKADYDAKVKAADDKTKEATELVDKNKKWWAETEPIFTKAKTTQAERDSLFEEKKKLETKIAELTTAAAAGGKPGSEGSVVDQAELAKAVEERVKGMGFVSESKLMEIVLQEAGKQRDTFLKETLPATMEYIFSVNDIAMRHREEFHEPFDRVAYLKFIHENQLGNLLPDKAYDQYISEKRGKNNEAKMREEIEKDIRTKMSIPGTGTVTGPPTGSIPEEGSALVEYIKATAAKDDGGTMSGAMAAAAELRKEGKAA
jgi:hypothetical protein